jgi:hypothetical protein
VAENPPEADGEKPATPEKPKLKRPPTIGDRRRVRGDAPELEMIGRLGAQAQEILDLALRSASSNPSVTSSRAISRIWSATAARSWRTVSTACGR